jgi:hypothetical protein
VRRSGLDSTNWSRIYFGGRVLGNSDSHNTGKFLNNSLINSERRFFVMKLAVSVKVRGVVLVVVLVLVVWKYHLQPSINCGEFPHSGIGNSIGRSRGSDGLARSCSGNGAVVVVRTELVVV